MRLNVLVKMVRAMASEISTNCVSVARTIPGARTHRSFCPRWTKLGSA
jgi:hypothetical protein